MFHLHLCALKIKVIKEITDMTHVKQNNRKVKLNVAPCRPLIYIQCKIKSSFSLLFFLNDKSFAIISCNV